MNNYQAPSTQQRLTCAAAAILASTLVLSSVLWLFTSAGTTVADTSSVSVQHQAASQRA